MLGQRCSNFLPNLFTHVIFNVPHHRGHHLLHLYQSLWGWCLEKGAAEEGLHQILGGWGYDVGVLLWFEMQFVGQWFQTLNNSTKRIVPSGGLSG